MSADASLALLVRADNHLFAIAVSRVQSVTLLRDAEVVNPSTGGGQRRLVRGTTTVPIYSLLALLGLEDTPWAAIVVLSDASESAVAANVAAAQGAVATAVGTAAPSTAIAIAVGKCEVVRKVDRLMALPNGAFVQAVPAITHLVATASAEQSELAYWLSCDRLQSLARLYAERDIAQSAGAQRPAGGVKPR
jgi:hypothetical protein